MPVRQASKLQTESDSRKYNPEVISSVPSINIRISGMQRAASTAATPERVVREPKVFRLVATRLFEM